MGDLGGGGPWLERMLSGPGMRVRALASLMLASVVVGGCSGGDDPVLDPTPMPPSTEVVSSEPADDATATPPQDQTPAPDPTAALEAEITAFFKEYIDVVNRSWTSKEALARRREMFADSCEECQVGYRLAERAHNENLVLDAGEVVVRDVQLTSVEGEAVVFLTVMDAPAGTLKTKEGEVVQEFDEYSGVQSVYQVVHSADGQWRIFKGEVL